MLFVVSAMFHAWKLKMRIKCFESRPATFSRITPSWVYRALQPPMATNIRPLLLLWSGKDNLSFACITRYFGILQNQNDNIPYIPKKEWVNYIT